jgi:S1-C subfamily serine protease
MSSTPSLRRWCRSGRTRGLGSGVVYDDHGDTVTSAQVMASAREFVVTLAFGVGNPLVF